MVYAEERFLRLLKSSLTRLLVKEFAHENILIQVFTNITLVNCIVLQLLWSRKLKQFIFCKVEAYICQGHDG